MPGVLRFNPLVFGMASEIGEGCDPREALKVVEELSFRPSKNWLGWFVGSFFLGVCVEAILEGSCFFFFNYSTSLYDLRVFSCCDNVQIFQRAHLFRVTLTFFTAVNLGFGTHGFLWIGDEGGSLEVRGGVSWLVQRGVASFGRNHVTLKLIYRIFWMGNCTIEFEILNIMNLMRRMYHVNNVTFIMISIWLVEFQPSTEVNDQMNWHRKGSLFLSLAEGRLSNRPQTFGREKRRKLDPAQVGFFVNIFGHNNVILAWRELVEGGFDL